MSAFFLTGTDTEIGKTLSACVLLHAWRSQGLRAVAYKPVAAGAECIDGIWSNEDARRLLAASSPGFSLEALNPVCLRSAVAPHIAAKEEGIRLELPAMIESFRQLQQTTDRIVVEGVGGFRVPLGENFDSADLACELGLPVLLVVGLRLGCLNHALLSAEAILARGLTLAGWIGNTPSASPMARHAENVETLRALLPAPCLGIFPHVADASGAELVGMLDLHRL